MKQEYVQPAGYSREEQSRGDGSSEGMLEHVLVSHSRGPKRVGFT